MYNILRAYGFNIIVFVRKYSVMSDIKYDKNTIDNLMKKIKENPDVIENYRELSNIYVVNNEFDSALSIYNKMLESFPDDVQAIFKL